ncbi:MAG: riboflavin synthase [Phycisphaeraceae bacterium]|nr:riboflavin synthase [Phycisphaeraceae bacterium]
MFTGIVQTVGRIEQRIERPGGVRLLIRPENWNHRAQPGESICISGVCLTHAPEADKPESGRAEDPQVLAFDVIRETLDRSMLGSLQQGDHVNIEPSLRADSLIAGHFVQGHVDAWGTIVDITQSPEEWRMRIEAPASLRPYVIPKGSIAVDGVSLTVAALDDPSGAGASSTFGFEIALIPTTLQITTLGTRKVGGTVNLEADSMAKTVVQWLELRFGAAGEHSGGAGTSGGGGASGGGAQTPAGGLTLADLQRAGFQPRGGINDS